MMFREPKEQKELTKTEFEELDSSLCLMHLKDIAVKQKNLKMLKDCLADFKKNGKELSQIDESKSSILCHVLHNISKIQYRKELDLTIEIIKLLAQNGAKLGEDEINAAKKADVILQIKSEIQFTPFDSLEEQLKTIETPLPSRKLN